MSKTTVEKVIDGLECKGTTGSNCKECQFRGNGEDCSVLAMKAAADMIRSQAARIDELEANLAAAEEKTGKAEAEADYAKDRLAQAIGEANQAKAELKAHVEAEQWHDLEKNPEDTPEDEQDVLCLVEYTRYGDRPGRAKRMDVGYYINGRWGGPAIQGQSARICKWRKEVQPDD